MIGANQHKTVDLPQTKEEPFNSSNNKADYSLNFPKYDGIVIVKPTFNRVMINLRKTHTALSASISEKFGCKVKRKF